MMNPQTSSIPQNRHQNNRGRSNRDTIQTHHPMTPYQHRAPTRVPHQPIYPQHPQFNPALSGQQHNQNRVLLRPPQQILPMGIGAPSLGGGGMIPAVQTPASLYGQQMVHQRFPTAATFPNFVPGQGTHQPINLMPHPSGLIPSLAMQTQPQPQQSTAIGTRPGGNNPIVMYQEPSLPMQTPQMQSGTSQPTQKKKSRAIPIINPDTKAEVDVHGTISNPVALMDKTNVEEGGGNSVKLEFKTKVSTAVSSSTHPPLVSAETVSGGTTSVPAPNAIITAPKETVKPTFPPVLDGPSEQILGGAVGGMESLGKTGEIVLKPVNDSEVADKTEVVTAEPLVVENQVGLDTVVAGAGVPVTGDLNNVRSDDVVSDRSENVSSRSEESADTEQVGTGSPMDGGLASHKALDADRSDVVEDTTGVGKGSSSEALVSEKPAEETEEEKEKTIVTDTPEDEAGTFQEKEDAVSSSTNLTSTSGSAASSSSQIGIVPSEVPATVAPSDDLEVKATVDIEPPVITTETPEVISETVCYGGKIQESGTDNLSHTEPLSEPSVQNSEDMGKPEDDVGVVGEGLKIPEPRPIEVAREEARSMEPVSEELDVQKQNMKNIVNGGMEGEALPISSNIVQEPEKELEPFSRISPEPEMPVIISLEPQMVNPPDPNEKKRYGRDFLIRFKNLPMCREPPPSLRNCGIFNPEGNYAMIPSGGNFHRGSGDGGRRQMSRPRVESKKIIPQPMEKKVVLHKAENPWMPAMKGEAGVLSDADTQTNELYRKFQGILNKLTPQKFQALAEQALKLEINSEERLSGCIDKIFTKALEEPSFSIAYANLCKVMSPIKVEFVTEEGKTKQTNFRRMLLTKCQREFEKEKKDDESMETMQKEIETADTDEKRAALKEEMEIAITKMRKRSLGNIRFIGELFKLQLLSEAIMHECITSLLKSTSDEESLECFARLITTTGKDLDKEAAKSRIDAYFRRINEIIKKGKVPARVRFMLQDVLELRNNKWVPRVRQDQQLKTIDQIHAEAAIEEAKEKEMVQHHQVVMKSGGGRDSRRGSKDDHATKDSRREREKFDQSKLKSLMSRKDKTGSGQSHLGPPAQLRPPGWKNKSGAASSQSSDGGKSSKSISRATTGPGSKSRADSRVGSRPGPPSLPGPRRSHTTPESEKESLLQTVNEFTTSKPLEAIQLGHAGHGPSRDAPAQAILCSSSDKRPVVPPPAVPDEQMIASVQRKITSTIDELVDNKDYKEAIECVKEIDLPGAMRQVVVEGINHTLERKAAFRTVTGELFSRLVQEKIISRRDFSDGLNDVLEMAEDIAIDIPKIWDYLGEVLAPAFAREHISLSILKKPPTSLLDSGCAAVLVAKLLSQCLAQLKFEEDVRRLWTESGLSWDDLGKQKEDVEEFLERQKLSFLLMKKPGTAMRDLPQALLATLHAQLISTDTTNDDINQWIKKNCADLGYNPALLVTNLTSAVVHASVTGSGDQAVFNQDQFERRMEVVKSQGHYGVAVLHGLQCSVAKLSHPPKLLSSLFDVVYDLELVDEREFYTWMDDDQVMYGKGAAVASVKPFFDWLKSDSKCTDQT